MNRFSLCVFGSVSISVLWKGLEIQEAQSPCMACSSLGTLWTEHRHFFLAVSMDAVRLYVAVSRLYECVVNNGSSKGELPHWCFDFCVFVTGDKVLLLCHHFPELVKKRFPSLALEPLFVFVKIGSIKTSLSLISWPATWMFSSSYQGLSVFSFLFTESHHCFLQHLLFLTSQWWVLHQVFLVPCNCCVISPVTSTVCGCVLCLCCRKSADVHIEAVGIRLSCVLPPPSGLVHVMMLMLSPFQIGSVYSISVISFSYKNNSYYNNNNSYWYCDYELTVKSREAADSADIYL